MSKLTPISVPGLRDPGPGFTIPVRNLVILQPASLLRRDLAEGPYGDLSGLRKVREEVQDHQNRPKIALFGSILGRFWGVFGGSPGPEDPPKVLAKTPQTFEVSPVI